MFAIFLLIIIFCSNFTHIFSFFSTTLSAPLCIFTGNAVNGVSLAVSFSYTVLRKDVRELSGDCLPKAEAGLKPGEALRSTSVWKRLWGPVVIESIFIYLFKVISRLFAHPSFFIFLLQSSYNYSREYSFASSQPRCLQVFDAQLWYFGLYRKREASICQGGGMLVKPTCG